MRERKKISARELKIDFKFRVVCTIIRQKLRYVENNGNYNET